MAIQVKSKRFILVRFFDEKNKSGTGKIAEGIEFPDGTCIMQWQTSPSSICIFKDQEELINLHGHNQATQIRWIDGNANEK